jgi:hypothetical protein
MPGIDAGFGQPRFHLERIPKNGNRFSDKNARKTKKLERNE